MASGISGVSAGVGVASIGGAGMVGAGISTAVAGAPPSAPAAAPSPSSIVTLGLKIAPSISNVKGASAYQAVGEATGPQASMRSMLHLNVGPGSVPNSFKVNLGAQEMSIDFNQGDPLKGLDNLVAALLLALLLKHMNEQ